LLREEKLLLLTGLVWCASVVAVSNITTETLARAFVLDWVAVYGTPLLFLTDNGTQFISKFFQTVCRLLGVKQLFTIAYHTSTNG
jgi:transposase InsO family protein